MSELPKLYHTKINKNKINLQKVYSTIETPKEEIREDKKYSNIPIEQKINNIFNDKGFVYKADVTIITDNDICKKRIVARNKNNLITMENEYIPISMIRDIYK